MNYSKCILITFLFVAFFGLTQNQSKAQSTSTVKQAINGKQIVTKYREGGSYYGTYYTYYYNFCNNGSLYAYGSSTKTTVLDNTQHNNYGPYYGQWAVVSSQGQVYIKIKYNTGYVNYMPITIYRNGSLVLGNQGGRSSISGYARCR